MKRGNWMWMDDPRHYYAGRNWKAERTLLYRVCPKHWHWWVKNRSLAYWRCLKLSWGEKKWVDVFYTSRGEESDSGSGSEHFTVSRVESSRVSPAGRNGFGRVEQRRDEERSTKEQRRNEERVSIVYIYMWMTKPPLEHGINSLVGCKKKYLQIRSGDWAFSRCGRCARMAPIGWNFKMCVYIHIVRERERKREKRALPTTNLTEPVRDSLSFRM
jgi:hypothetical protein